jgi:hypothetical protein
MLILLNVFILAYLILMAYYWGSIQGLLSAFLHLLLTIVAGALALALWEPLTFWLASWGSVFTLNAFALGLLVPFFLVLAVLRLAMDKAVPGNLQFHPLVNVLAGGACGLMAGILTAGLTLIGVAYLPLDSELMGYQPLKIDAGKVTGRPGDGLWVPVDRQASSFFTALSGGAFFTSQSLALYQPDMALQAHTLRLSRAYDPNSTLSAVPDKLTVSGVVDFEHAPLLKGVVPDIREKLGLDAAGPDSRLVIVDTEWDKAAQMFEDFSSDGKLRVPPTQVRLITWNEQGRGEAQLRAPVGAVKMSGSGDKRKYMFVQLDADGYYPYDASQKAQLGWVFLLSGENGGEKSEEPRFILLRNFRLELPKAESVADAEMVKRLGRYEPTTATADGKEPSTSTHPGPMTGGVGPVPFKAGSVELNDGLPTEISKNMGRSLEYSGNFVLSGVEDVPPYSEATVRLSKEIRADRVFAAPDQAIVRVRIDPQKAKELFGRIISDVKMLEAIFLEDSEWATFYAKGFAWLQGSGVETIHFDSNKEIKIGKDLPIPQMKAGDTFYLYFAVTRGKKITAFHLGSKDKQDLDLAIPDKSP